MPSYKLSESISADPASVYAVVADLEGHGAWSADALEITPVDDAPDGAGKRYRSTARAKGKTFTADLVVTEHTPPERFAFVATDATGHYRHEFTIVKTDTGSVVERCITARLTPAQWLLFALAYLPVKRPSARATMAKLKERCEQAAG